jgi:ComF family protein
MITAAKSSIGFLYKMGALFKDAVFPMRCCTCRKFYQHDHAYMVEEQPPWPFCKTVEISLSAFLCNSCMQQLTEPEKSSFCTLCGRFFESSETIEHLCGSCQQTPFEFTMARSTGKYDDVLRTLICLYKYKWRSELAEPLARLLWQTLLSHWAIDRFDCVIPVPLHRRRLRERGFNQVAFLIQQWPRIAREQRFLLTPDWIRNHILIRCRATLPQTGLRQHQRADNMRHAFKLTDVDAVADRRILLVDDVLTTGATANACTKVLKKGNAADVKVLTLARAC